MIDLRAVKKAVLCFLCAVMLTGCGFAGTTYQEYVLSVMECVYHDDSDSYCALTNVSQEEAEKMHDQEVEVLSQRIQNYFGLDTELISDKIKGDYDALA